MGKRPNDVTKRKTFCSAVRSPLALTTFDTALQYIVASITRLLTNVHRQTSTTINFPSFFPSLFFLPFLRLPFVLSTHIISGAREKNSRAHQFVLCAVYVICARLNRQGKIHEPMGVCFFCLLLLWSVLLFFRPYIISLFSRLFCSVILVWLADMGRLRHYVCMYTDRSNDGWLQTPRIPRTSQHDAAAWLCFGLLARFHFMTIFCAVRAAP